MHNQDAKSDLSLRTCLESPQYTDTSKETIQDMGAIWIHDPGQAVLGVVGSSHCTAWGKDAHRQNFLYLSLFITKFHFYMCVGGIVPYKKPVELAQQWRKNSIMQIQIQLKISSS